MALNQAERAYLEYIRKLGGWYLADELTRHYLGSQLGLSPADFQEMHRRLVKRGLISASADGAQYNKTDSSTRVSITGAGEAALKQTKAASSARKSVWWNPWSWW
jgi:DNA-binding MarR family transcriptional regulator